MKLSYDKILTILEKHKELWEDATGQYISHDQLLELADDLDDLFLEAFREGQKDPDWDR